MPRARVAAVSPFSQNSVADPWILLHSEMVGHRNELTAASAAQALEQKMIARKECAVALRALASMAISNAAPATIRRYAEGLPEAAALRPKTRATEQQVRHSLSLPRILRGVATSNRGFECSLSIGSSPGSHGKSILVRLACSKGLFQPVGGRRK